MNISVIIPSFNQGDYLDETLDSAFAAGRSPEVIVIDGGSTDCSLETLKRWDSKLSYWVSEPDRGQADAINKGLAKATGDVWCYLNSDDLLEPGALDLALSHFRKDNIHWLSGNCTNFDANGTCGGIVPSPVLQDVDYLRPWREPRQYAFPFSGACFMSRAVYEQLGGFDASYHYSMDMEYYTRAYFKGGYRQTLTDTVLSLIHI